MTTDGSSNESANEHKEPICADDSASYGCVHSEVGCHIEIGYVRNANFDTDIDEYCDDAEIEVAERKDRLLFFLLFFVVLVEVRFRNIHEEQHAERQREYCDCEP